MEGQKPECAVRYQTTDWRFQWACDDSVVRAPHSAFNSGFRLGFAQAGDPVAIVPLAAFLAQRGPCEAFQDIAFGAGCADGAKTPML